MGVLPLSLSKERGVRARVSRGQRNEMKKKKKMRAFLGIPTDQKKKKTGATASHPIIHSFQSSDPSLAHPTPPSSSLPSMLARVLAIAAMADSRIRSAFSSWMDPLERSWHHSTASWVRMDRMEAATSRGLMPARLVISYTAARFGEVLAELTGMLMSLRRKVAPEMSSQLPSSRGMG